jgi:hypothetical protein
MLQHFKENVGTKFLLFFHLQAAVGTACKNGARSR